MAINTPELIASLSAQAQPVTPLRPAYYARLVLGVLLAYTCAIVFWMHPRPDIAVQLQNPLFVAEIILLITTLIVATRASIFAMRPTSLRTQRVLMLPYLCAGTTAALVMAQLFLTPATHAAHPEHSLECALFIALTAMLPAMLMVLILRKGASVMPQHASTLAIISAVAVGALSLRIIEAGDGAAHLLLFHYLPSASFACLGALLGRWMLKW